MRFQWKREWTTPVVVGVASFAAGAGTGYMGYKIKLDRQVERDLQAMSERVVAGVKEDARESNPHIHVNFGDTFERYMKKGLDSDGNTRSDHVEGPALDIPSSTDLAIIEEGTTDDTPLPDPPVQEVEDRVLYQGKPVTQNIFDTNWDQAAEEAERTTDAPYILHQDEFYRNDKGYTQVTLEWFDGDKILTGPDRVPIYGEDKVVGRLEFGRGTNDPDTVYIRNDQLRAEYEVVRNSAAYQEEVMGLRAEEEAEEDELRHSQRITRFRWDD